MVCSCSQPLKTGFPASRSIASPPQMPAQPGDFLPEPHNRHLLPWQRQGGSDEHDGSRLHTLCCCQLRRASRHIAQLHQAHRDGREPSQQADHPLDGAQGTLLQATAGFEALMRLFHDPATALPVHARPRVFTRRRLQRRRASSIQALLRLQAAQPPTRALRETGRGSLLPRGSFPGGSRVAGPQLIWSVACLAWCP
jgi:hypothetical protein